MLQECKKLAWHELNTSHDGSAAVLFACDSEHGFARTAPVSRHSVSAAQQLVRRRQATRLQTAVVPSPSPFHPRESAPGHLATVLLSHERMIRGSVQRWLAGSVALSLLCVSPARAQSVAPTTRTDTIAAAQTEKAKDLQPYVGNKGERLVDALEEALISGRMKWHPFFETALAGGGFTLGAGYRQHVSLTTPSTCAARSRSRDTRGSRRSFSRRGCSTAAAYCR